MAKPYVVGFESVAGNGNGAQTRLTQLAEFLLRKGQTVGHHTPGIAALVQGTTDIRKVLAHQGLTAGDDDKHLVRIDMRRHLGV